MKRTRSPSILIVGQDFNSLATYERISQRGTEVDVSVTWRNLRNILSAAKIPASACVFTNLYMGLRATGPETGKFPGAKDRAFSDRCKVFFARQIAVWRPKLLITLGLPALTVVGASYRLSIPRRLCDCDSIFQDIAVPHGMMSLVALTHPSFYGSNVERRRYGHLNGRAAELAMLADGTKLCGLDVCYSIPDDGK